MFINIKTSRQKEREFFFFLRHVEFCFVFFFCLETLNYCYLGIPSLMMDINLLSAHEFKTEKQSNTTMLSVMGNFLNDE